MDTLDLEYTSLIDSSMQQPIFGTKVLDEISKIDNNESHEIFTRLSKAEIKAAKLSAACQVRDTEIARLERVNLDLKNQLKSSGVEDLSLSLQHMRVLNKALEHKFQDSQIKIYHTEKAEKNEIKELKFRIEELRKDKKYLEEILGEAKDREVAVQSERNYLKVRNHALERRVKAAEGLEYGQEREGDEKEEEKKSSLYSAIKLFQEFPLGKER